jgi:hypothetical protein
MYNTCIPLLSILIIYIKSKKLIIRKYQMLLILEYKNNNDVFGIKRIS